MSKKKIIEVEGSEVVVIQQNSSDYISLTDMAKYKNAEATGVVISHWLSTRYAIDFLGIWERFHNPNFNVTEFRNIRMEAGTNGFVLTSKQWIEKTGAIGIVSTAGERLTQLNTIAISQMHSLLENNEIKKLTGMTDANSHPAEI